MPQMWNPPLCQKRSVWVILNATKRGGGPKPPPDDFPLNRSLPTPGGLMADVPCLDRSLDGC